MYVGYPRPFVEVVCVTMKTVLGITIRVALPIYLRLMGAQPRSVKCADSLEHSLDGFTKGQSLFKPKAPGPDPGVVSVHSRPDVGGGPGADGTTLAGNRPR